MIEKRCFNCGRNKKENMDKQGFCIHDNVQRIFMQEKAEACPMWTPRFKKEHEFIEAISRKFESRKSKKGVKHENN